MSDIAIAKTTYENTYLYVYIYIVKIDSKMILKVVEFEVNFQYIIALTSIGSGIGNPK